MKNNIKLRNLQTEVTHRSFQNQVAGANYFENEIDDLQEQVNVAVRGINQKLKNPYKMHQKSYYDQTDFNIKDTFIRK